MELKAKNHNYMDMRQIHSVSSSILQNQYNPPRTETRLHSPGDIVVTFQIILTTKQAFFSTSVV
jgi:hypothetical protein